MIRHTLTRLPGCFMMWSPLLVVTDLSFASCVLLSFISLICLFLLASAVCRFSDLYCMYSNPFLLLSWNLFELIEDRHRHRQPWIYHSLGVFVWDLLENAWHCWTNEVVMVSWLYSVQGKMDISLPKHQLSLIVIAIIILFIVMIT